MYCLLYIIYIYHCVIIEMGICMYWGTWSVIKREECLVPRRRKGALCLEGHAPHLLLLI